MAAAVSQAAQSVFGQILGRPVRNDMDGNEQGAPQGFGGPQGFAAVPTAAATFAAAGRAMSHSEGLAAQRTGQIAGGAPGGTPPFAGGGAIDPNDPFASLQGASRMAAQAMDPMSAAAAAAGVPAGAGLGAGLPAGVAPVAAGVSALAAASAPAMIPAATGGAERSCPLCGKIAGKGKFCIECGQFIGAAETAPVPTQINPAPAMSAATGAPASGMQQQQAIVGPMGSRGANGNNPQPRYGGLAVTPRDNMPAKKPSLFESPAQIAEAAQQMRQASPLTPEEQARLMQGTGGMPNAGPLSSRVAMQASAAINETPAQPAENPHHRAPLKSFHPDISKFGFDQNAQKPGTQPGVEF
jgi:hypothetical protein